MSEKEREKEGRGDRDRERERERERVEIALTGRERITSNIIFHDIPIKYHNILLVIYYIYINIYNPIFSLPTPY